MKEYLIKITTNQSLGTVKKYIEEKYQLKDGEHCRKKDKYIPSSYVYELPERGKRWKGLSDNLERLRTRLNNLSRKTGSLNFYYKDWEVTLDLTEAGQEQYLPNLLIDSKLNGGDSITLYEKGFSFELNDYDIEKIDY